jgi:hypothetical protein
LTVDWLDKAKSTLMGVAYEKKRRLPAGELGHVESEWTEIYRILGKERVSNGDVLTIAANLTADEAPAKGYQEENALEFFRKEAHLDVMTPVEMSKVFRQVVSALDQFLQDPRNRALCRGKQARLLAAATLLSSRLRNDAKSRQKALRVWEKAMFRRYVLGGGDARDRVGECVRLASGIRRGVLSITQILEELEEIGNVTPEEVALVLYDVYVYEKWTGEEIVYFFWKYEEGFAAENGEKIDQVTWLKIWQSASKEKSIEPIFPQKDPNGNWKGKVRQKVKSESFVHRLGNLLVLPPGINSKACTKAFAGKTEIYKTVGGLLHVRKVARMRDCTLEAVEKREKELMRFATEEWW